jgi:hypothetical protein
VSVLAAVSIAVCWFVFAAVWLITANYNEIRAPAQRQRSWYGTGVIPVVIISTVIRLAVPRADWHSLTFYAPWARFLGLAILLAATALTLWARFALGLMWSAVPAVKEVPSCALAGRTPSPGTLRRSQPLIEAFCQQRGVPYCRASLVDSYAQAVRHPPCR